MRVGGEVVVAARGRRTRYTVESRQALGDRASAHWRDCWMIRSPRGKLALLWRKESGAAWVQDANGRMHEARID